ncbi:MAG: hypothetical protein ACE5D1_07070, partial [Fidelibacterota bacterium]
MVNKRYLNPAGWTLKLGDLAGHAFTGLNFREMELSDSSGIRLQVRQGRFRLDFAELIRRKPALQLLELEGLELRAPDLLNRKGVDTTGFALKLFPLAIEDLRLQGRFAYLRKGQPQAIYFALSGYYQANNKQGKLRIDTLDVKTPFPPDTLMIYHSVLVGRSDELTCFPFNGMLGNLELSGKLQTNFRNRITTGSLAFNPLSLAEIFPDFPVVDSTFSHLDGSFDFQVDTSALTGNFRLNPMDNQPVTGRLLLKNRAQSWVLDSLEIRRNTSRIQISGVYDSLRQFNGLVELRPLHLNDWVQVPSQNSLDGTLILSGQNLYDSSMAVSVSFDINETEALETPTLIAGTVNIRDREISLAVPLLISQAGGRIQLTGSYRMDSGKLTGGFQAKGLDLKTFRNITGGAGGVLSGHGTWKGVWPYPSITSDLTLVNGSFKNLRVESIALSGEVALDTSGSSGNIHLTSDNLQWQNQTADHATGDFQLQGDELTFDNIHLSRDQDYIQLSGKINRQGQVTVDRFQAAYGGHLLVNPKPVDFTLSSTGVRTKPFELHVDDGIISGVVRKEKNLDLRLKITNISAELISSFIPDKRLQLKGLMFGEVGLNTSPEERKVSLDMSLKNGELAGEKFDDMIVAGLLENNILNIDELAMTKNGRTGLQISGIVPVKADTNQPVMIDLSAQFNRFRLKSLTQFIPHFFEITGIVSGAFGLGGSGGVAWTLLGATA